MPLHVSGSTRAFVGDEPADFYHERRSCHHQRYRDQAQPIVSRLQHLIEVM